MKAFELKNAEGRFFVTAGSYNNLEIVNIIRDKFPDLEDKLPRGDGSPGYPKEGVYTADNSKSLEILGLKYHTLETTVVDLVISLQKLGA